MSCLPVEALAEQLKLGKNLVYRLILHKLVALLMQCILTHFESEVLDDFSGPALPSESSNA